MWIEIDDLESKPAGLDDYETVLVAVPGVDEPHRLTHRLAMWDPDHCSWTVFMAEWDPDPTHWMRLPDVPKN